MIKSIKDLPKLLGRSRKGKKGKIPRMCTCSLPCECAASGRCGLALLQQRFVGPVALGRQLSPGETATVWGMGMHCREGREGGMQGCKRQRRGARPTNNINWRGSDNSPIICTPIQCSLVKTEISKWR